MKAIFTLGTFLVMLPLLSVGQTPPRVKKELTRFHNPHSLYTNGTPITTLEKTYEYDEKGNIQLEYFEDYSIFDSTNVFRFGVFYEYNDANQLEKKLTRMYNPDVDLFITLDWIDYIYDDRGCLVEAIETGNFGGVGVGNKITYERDEMCREMKRTIWLRQYPTNELVIEKAYETEYFEDNISFLERELLMIGGTLNKFREETTLFNDFGNIDFFQHVYFGSGSDSVFVERKFYEYDEHQNLVFQNHERRQVNTGMTNWLDISESSYQNEYDENDFLVEVKISDVEYQFGNPQIGPDDERVLQYDYLCNGLEILKVDSIPRSDNYLTTRTFYEGEIPCFDFEKINQKISIFPNPTFGTFTIESPIFQSGNTQIAVYSFDGKVLLQTVEISQCEQVDFQLSENLPNGFYIIELSNQENYLTKKIILSR